MASQVSIANQALSFLGADPITSFDDDQTEAKLIKANYDPVRLALLEAHNWTFATLWATLNQVASPPENQYENAFALPPKTLRVIFAGVDFNHPMNQWRKEGNFIWTNDAAVKVQYLEDVTDPNRFSALFVQAFAQRLAADLTIPLTNSRSLMESHWNLYEIKLKQAVGRDQLQGKARRIRSLWLENGRRSYGRGGVSGPTV